jgi:hypothetical protein
MTFAPCACSRRQIAAPTRFAPPVTSAALPARFSLIASLLN